MEDDLKKMEDEPINLIGCDNIVNSPSTTCSGFTLAFQISL